MNTNQPSHVGLGLILLAIAVCFAAMGQDRSKVGIIGEATGKDWVAIPHDSGNIIYYLRIDQVMAIVEVIDEDTAASGAFGRSEIVLTGGMKVRTNMTFDEVTAARELSRDDPSEAREAYLSSEKRRE